MKFGLLIGALCMFLETGEATLLTKLATFTAAPVASVPVTSTTSTTVSSNTNLLVNGKFEDPELKSGWRNLKSMTGWKNSDTIEQGLGNIYNKNWGSKVVLELDASKNYCVEQSVNLTEGQYRFELDYAAREGFLQTSAISVSVNGNEVEKIFAKDTNIYVLSFNLSVDCAGPFVIKICGAGTSNSYGMTIGRAELIRVK